MSRNVVTNIGQPAINVAVILLLVGLGFFLVIVNSHGNVRDP